MAILGNLGTLRMIVDGFKVIAAPINDFEDSTFFSRVLWTIQGIFKAITGSPLPYRMDEFTGIPAASLAPNMVARLLNFLTSHSYMVISMPT